MLHFILYESPMNIRVVELCTYYKARKQRVIVFVNSPHTQA